MNKDFFLLEGLERFSDLGTLCLRLLTGAFLVYGVIDNVVSAERMEEFSIFLGTNGFLAPRFMAPLSVYLQLLCGIAFVLGAFTRWAGLLIALHFVIGLIMVHWSQDFRGWWPAAVLVAIGLEFAATGARGLSIDALLTARGDS